MKPAVVLAALLLGICGVLAGPASGEIIRLKNGVELKGEIISFDAEKGITVKRYDNGGIIDLRWDHILDADAEALKRSRGYGDLETQAIMIRAKRLLLASGDYVVGVPVESSRPGVVTLHRQGKDYEYLHNQVKDVETVEVEAQEVYTPEELYDKKVAEGLPETALDHFKMGVFCESIAYYSRALEHYRAAAELDPSFKPDAVAEKIRQMEVKQSEADATALLNTIRNRLYKKKFSSALELCDEFASAFPKSRQMGEMEKVRAKIIAARHAYYRQHILTDYFTYMERVAVKIATNKEMKLDDALAYARDQMGEDIRKILAGVYGMEEQEIEDLWANRKGGRQRSASYGSGTFILGAEAKSLPAKEEEEAAAEKKKKEEEESASLDERLKKKIEEIKKERAKRSSQRRASIQIEDIGMSPEQWWASARTEDKKQLLCAYYAEKSGDLKILKVKFLKCPACNGKGWFEFFSSGDEKKSRKPCTSCKTLGIVRVVYFK